MKQTLINMGYNVFSYKFNTETATEDLKKFNIKDDKDILIVYADDLIFLQTANNGMFQIGKETTDEKELTRLLNNDGSCSICLSYECKELNLCENCSKEICLECIENIGENFNRYELRPDGWKTSIDCPFCRECF